MSTRILAAVIATAGCIAGFEAPASAASDHAPNRSQPVTLIGCVAQMPDGALRLTNAVRGSMARRTTGSNSAKASTPIGNVGPAVDRPRTPGSGTPKGSAPVHVVAASYPPPATSGANSPKASTPVARTPPSYALDGASSDVALLAWHAVEVVGVIEQRVLKIEKVRAVADGCAP